MFIRSSPSVLHQQSIGTCCIAHWPVLLTHLHACFRGVAIAVVQDEDDHASQRLTATFVRELDTIQVGMLAMHHPPPAPVVAVWSQQ